MADDFRAPSRVEDWRWRGALARDAVVAAAAWAVGSGGITRCFRAECSGREESAAGWDTAGVFVVAVFFREEAWRKAAAWLGLRMGWVSALE